MSRERGRPSKSDVVSPQVLLQRAFIMFATDGYDAVSLRRLGAESGVDPALYRHYFGGKEELWRKAIEAELLPLAGELIERLRREASQLDAVTALRHNITSGLLIASTRPHLIGVFFQDLGQDSERRRWLYEAVVAPYLAHIDGLIIANQESGALKRSSLEAVHAMIFGVLRMLIDPGLMQSRMQPVMESSEQLRTYIESSVEILFSGLCASSKGLPITM